MGQALVTLPDGRKAKITFDTPEQLDQTVNDLVAHSSAPEAPQLPQRSAGEEVGRQVGLAGRYATEGALALPGALANVPAYAMNKILDATEHLSGHKIDYRFPDQNQNISDTLTKAGLPQPGDEAERLVGDASRAVTGAGTGIGAGKALANAGSEVVNSVGSQLASQPLLQGVSAASGGVTGGAVREGGGGPWAQFAASVAGGATPFAAANGSQSLVRGALRGGEEGQQTMQANIKAFKDSGTTPSVGQATEGRFAQATESLLSKVPGSAGKMTERAQNQASEISSGLDARAAKLAPKSTAEQAGRAIQKGVSGEGGFTEKFKAQQETLYNKLDEHIAKDTPVDVSNTAATLSRLNSKINGAENVSELFINGKIKGIESALQRDINPNAASINGLKAAKTVGDLDKMAEKLKIGMSENPTPADQQIEQLFFNMRSSLRKGESPDVTTESGKLPYEAVKKLRTLVGNEISDSWAGSDVPRSKWNALYGALSKDMEAAAKDAGPAATLTWQRANTYTRVGMKRIESISHVIDKSGGPEKIFQAAISGAPEGATTLRAVMQSLPKDAQKTLAATVLRRLGRAVNSKQSDTGEVFSTETFLTNWNKLSPEAKRTLFDRHGADFRQSMDQVAKVASNLREGSKVFVNPSGTGQATAQTSAATGFLISLFTGHPGGAAAIAGTATAANLSARLMTNPKFVNWLAKSTRAPIGAAPALINNLAQINDADVQEFVKISKEQKQK